jgi:hypothetical protein
MKVTLEFGAEITPAVQRHLEDGTPVRAYVRAAVKFFTNALKQESAGASVGYGPKPRFSQYNTEMSPRSYLDNIVNDIDLDD